MNIRSRLPKATEGEMLIFLYSAQRNKNMEENLNNNPTEQVIKKSFKKFYFWGGLAVLAALASGAGYVWKSFNPTPYDQGMKVIEDYENLLRADTYGGQTPEETLALFVAALKEEDVALASKYFSLDDNGSRERWVVRLTELQEKKLLQTMAGDIETKAKPDLQNKISETDFKFVLYQDDGLVGADIDMELNKKSGVWKIESL